MGTGGRRFSRRRVDSGAYSSRKRLGDALASSARTRAAADCSNYCTSIPVRGCPGFWPARWGLRPAATKAARKTDGQSWGGYPRERASATTLVGPGMWVARIVGPWCAANYWATRASCATPDSRDDPPFNAATTVELSNATSMVEPPHASPHVASARTIGKASRGIRTGDHSVGQRHCSQRCCHTEAQPHAPEALVVIRCAGGSRHSVVKKATPFHSLSNDLYQRRSARASRFSRTYWSMLRGTIEKLISRRKNDRPGRLTVAA